MDSSERAFAGGRSNFSQTCSLLSNYLKERGTFGDLNLGLTLNSGIHQTRETMNLLPKIEESSQEERTGSDTKTNQMMIFYRGQVMVFDNFPADKAEEIMSMAKNSNAPFCPPSPAESTTSNAPARFRPAVADLPITRKHSLARFFEKRKDRIAAKAPYQVSMPATAKNNAAWLGLGPGFEIQRH